VQIYNHGLYESLASGHLDRGHHNVSKVEIRVPTSFCYVSPGPLLRSVLEDVSLQSLLLRGEILTSMIV
jgi:hypothetical protein